MSYSSKKHLYKNSRKISANCSNKSHRCTIIIQLSMISNNSGKLSSNRNYKADPYLIQIGQVSTKCAT